MRWQQTMARKEGLYIEPSSAAGLAAVEQLVRGGRIGPEDSVVSLLTASGLKDPAATAALQGAMVSVPADFDDAVAILRAAGIFP